MNFVSKFLLASKIVTQLLFDVITTDLGLWLSPRRTRPGTVVITTSNPSWDCGYHHVEPVLGLWLSPRRTRAGTVVITTSNPCWDCGYHHVEPVLGLWLSPRRTRAGTVVITTLNPSWDCGYHHVEPVLGLWLSPRRTRAVKILTTLRLDVRCWSQVSSLYHSLLQPIYHHLTAISMAIPRYILLMWFTTMSFFP